MAVYYYTLFFVAVAIVQSNPIHLNTILLLQEKMFLYAETVD